MKPYGTRRTVASQACTNGIIQGYRSYNRDDKLSKSQMMHVSLGRCHIPGVQLQSNCELETRLRPRLESLHNLILHLLVFERLVSEDVRTLAQGGID